LVSGSGDYTVRLWDTREGKELLVWRGHDHRVATVAVSPDGRRAASGGLDGLVKVWTIPDEK
jgi:WD40 repeat protein